MKVGSKKIKDGIERFPDTKMFACAQYSLDEPSLMDGAGDCYHIFGIPWRGGYGRPVEEMPEEGECFSPCGASAVFHRQTFLDVEGFDESFFCYCEDVDLGFRLRLMGHRCIFLPQAMIHHAGSALSNKVGDFALYHGTRNRFVGVPSEHAVDCIRDDADSPSIGDDGYFRSTRFRKTVS